MKDAQLLAEMSDFKPTCIVSAETDLDLLETSIR